MDTPYEILKEQPEFDYLFKVVIIGDGKVGKSSILSKLNDD